MPIKIVWTNLKLTLKCLNLSVFVHFLNLHPLPTDDQVLLLDLAVQLLHLDGPFPGDEGDVQSVTLKNISNSHFAIPPVGTLFLLPAQEHYQDLVQDLLRLEQLMKEQLDAHRG